MPVKDYKAYAASPKGQAARARARAAYIERRRNGQVKWRKATSHLAPYISNWGRHEPLSRH